MKNLNTKNFIKFIHINQALYKKLKIEEKKKNNKDKIISILKSFVINCKKKLKKKNNTSAIIICLYPKTRKTCELKAVFIKKICEVMSNIVGTTLIQNDKKQKLIEVYDRDRKLSMHKGSRYHQTREGGSIHTDNVNVKETWDFLMFGCLSSSKAGGETILVNGKALHQILASDFKEAKKILEQNFIWEKRGVSDGFYIAPILTYDKDRSPKFRYLRPYLESAYQRKNKSLSPKQLYALDTLDAILETSSNQFRYKMIKGDILFNLDSKVLHGRTSFSDDLNALPLDKIKGNDIKLKRTMIRVWIKEKSLQL